MMNQASRDKCLKEIQLLQSLKHPNIIRYEDSYIDLATKELVIVLQWARGGDLKKLIKKVKGGQAKITEFSEGMIWKYAAELAGGIAYMHQKRSELGS
jgi:serine/threonine protein kinase